MHTIYIFGMRSKSLLPIPLDISNNENLSITLFHHL